MKHMKLLVFMLLGLLWSVPASAFTNGDILDAITTAHQDESEPYGLPYVSKIEQAPAAYNAWNMLFRVEYTDLLTHQKKVIGIPTTLRYAGNALYVKNLSTDVDRRVAKAVLEDVSGTIEDLKDYTSGALDGFKSNIGHDGRRIVVEGSINIAGKSLDDVREIVVELREELEDLYKELYEANEDALEDYFKDVLAKRYDEVTSVKTFSEIVDHGFSFKTQTKKRATNKGHWVWSIQDIDVETLNYGDHFEEVIWLKTGSNISKYNLEKMYDELRKRVRARLPKGAKSFEVRPHVYQPGVTAIAFKYPYKKTRGKSIKEYHARFIVYAETIDPDLEKIIKKYVASLEIQKVLSLTAEAFMRLISDGLEGLPIHEITGANGQWKFQYKGVPYIITNYKHHMQLSFIFTLPDSSYHDDALVLMNKEIEDKYDDFADRYKVTGYKGSERTIMVSMNIKYGVLSSTDILGKKIKEKYTMFTQVIAPDLQSKLKSLAGI